MNNKAQRNGQHAPRNFGNRPKELGYYIIYTDTKETEENYINGYRAALPVDIQKKIDIQVEKAGTQELVDGCYNYVKSNPQYSSPWIIFDKDLVQNFNEIIQKAEDKNINVAWSNPCIEIWFSGYLGKIDCFNSVTCCKNFKELLKQKTGKEYDKGDKKIYSILKQYGDETTAIKTFKVKHTNAIKDGLLPSDQVGVSSVYLLIELINNIINQQHP